MELRPYQKEAYRAILSEWERVRRTLLVLPTGTGKTIVFAHVTDEMVARGKRVLILAHRGELLDQAADKLARATGLECAVEKADKSCLAAWQRVVVGSVQTMMRPNRLAQFKPDHFGCIIVDEAHHVLAESYQKILEHFTEARVLGVTATPDRGDMQELGTFFDSLAYEYPLPKAIKEGYLCPIKALTLPLKLDMTKVGVQSGDFKAADVGNALDPYLEQIAGHVLEHCRLRRTVLFLPLIATSQKMLGYLQAAGINAVEVNGDSPDRDDILRDFQDGRYSALCNSMLLTEGWDCPRVDCIVVLRPTKIRSLYAQMVGRGTRIAEGKDHLLLLDFLWHCERHELCRPAHLIAESPEIAKAMIEDMEQELGAVDLEAAEAAAQSNEIEKREERLAERLREMQRRKRKLVDPLQFEMSIQDQDLAGYTPAFLWECEPVTDQQKQQLEKVGLFPEEIENRGKAEKLLKAVNDRRLAGLATPKQIRLLERFGFRHVGTWEFETARKMIDGIAACGWRLPNGMIAKTYVPVARQDVSVSAKMLSNLTRR